MEIDEKKLIELSQKGNVKAFEDLVLIYEKHVYNIAYRFMGNYEDAVDLSQEVFIKAYKSLKNFRGDSSFKTWIYHIVANVCRDELRKRKKHNSISLDAPISSENGEFSREIEDTTYCPELIYELKEEQYEVQQLLNNLPLEYKEVIIMREIQEFTYDEISKQLNCSLGTVKSRLNRARKALKKYLLSKKELFVENTRLTK